LDGPIPLTEPGTGGTAPGSAAAGGESWFQWLRAEATAKDSYGLLLVLLVIDYLVLSVGTIGSFALTVSAVTVSLTILLAFHTSMVRGRLFTAVKIAVLVAIVGSVAATLSDTGRGRGVAFALLALLMVASPVAVATRIVRHTRVTVHSLLGAISIYVLIGLDFAFADLAIQAIGGSSFFAQPGVHHSPDFLYFSFVTMTSLGYGDLSPAYGLPRTMSVLEALTGQIFLVVMVSRLVSLLTPSHRGARRDGADDGEPAPDGDG
jgi:hypothetical protein